MRRWNGWGDDSVIFSLPLSAVSYLERQMGKNHQPVDVKLEQVVTQISKSRLPKHPLISIDPLSRLLHARGHSFPDWVDLHSGQIGSFPDGVSYPFSNADVSDLIKFAQKSGVSIIPYGGGTSVVGHIDPIKW